MTREDMDKVRKNESILMKMRTYTGTKTIKATPMTRGEYNGLRGWKVPDNEDPTDAGYIVEYPGGGTNVDGFDGYVSWSPARQFEDAYKPSGTYVERMEIELSDLSDRIHKAQGFLQHADPAFYDKEELDMLSDQIDSMIEYHNILSERIQKSK